MNTGKRTQRMKEQKPKIKMNKTINSHLEAGNY
jgi:hypothetical protein